MAKLLNKLAPYTAMKVSIIDWLLQSMPESTKKIVIGRILAKHVPNVHVHANPKRKLI
jgi:hypothetical protein